MTDEELGRAWCEVNGKRPHKSGDGYHSWFKTRAVINLRSGPHNLPGELAVLWDGTHKTESAAYAALGAALRRVVAFAESVKEVMG